MTSDTIGQCGETIIIMLSYEEGIKEWAFTESPETLCLVYKADGGYYAVQATVSAEAEFSKSANSEFFPPLWWGLRDGALADVCGFQSAIFCHEDGYLMGFKDPSDALAAAEKVVNYHLFGD
jgi:uncharacterized UPF0160 family protein